MFTFTFNTLERVGILDQLYALLANLANKYVLSRHNFDTSYIADVFNALDGFWLKYGRTQRYNDSEVRVIVGSVVEMLRDNQLSSSEVRKISRYVMSKWNPEIAQVKATKPPETLLPPAIEEVATKSVEVFRELPQVFNGDIPEFVAIGTKLIADKVPENMILDLFKSR